MEEAFFIASKTLGQLARVETWMVIGLAAALIAGWRGRRGWSMALIAATLALVLGLTIYPLAPWCRRWKASTPPRLLCFRWTESSCLEAPRTLVPMRAGAGWR